MLTNSLQFLGDKSLSVPLPHGNNRAPHLADARVPILNSVAREAEASSLTARPLVEKMTEEAEVSSKEGEIQISQMCNVPSSKQQVRQLQVIMSCYLSRASRRADLSPSPSRTTGRRRALARTTSGIFSTASLKNTTAPTCSSSRHGSSCCSRSRRWSRSPGCS
jgi:hypothetical protein